MYLPGVTLLTKGDLVANFEHLRTFRMDVCCNLGWNRYNLGYHSAHYSAGDHTIRVSAERDIAAAPTGYPCMTRRCGPGRRSSFRPGARCCATRRRSLCRGTRPKRSSVPTSRGTKQRLSNGNILVNASARGPLVAGGGRTGAARGRDGRGCRLIGSTDFAAVCTLAGLDPEAVVERFNPETYQKLIRAAQSLCRAIRRNLIPAANVRFRAARWADSAPVTSCAKSGDKSGDKAKIPLKGPIWTFCSFLFLGFFGSGGRGRRLYSKSLKLRHFSGAIPIRLRSVTTTVPYVVPVGKGGEEDPVSPHPTRCLQWMHSVCSAMGGFLIYMTLR